MADEPSNKKLVAKRKSVLTLLLQGGPTKTTSASLAPGKKTGATSSAASATKKAAQVSKTKKKGSAALLKTPKTLPVAKQTAAAAAAAAATAKQGGKTASKANNSSSGTTVTNAKRKGPADSARDQHQNKGRKQQKRKTTQTGDGDNGNEAEAPGKTDIDTSNGDNIDDDDHDDAATVSSEEFARELVVRGEKLSMADITKALKLARVPLQARPNVVPKGERAVHGMVLGLYIYADRVGVTNASLRFPWLTKLLAQFGRQSVPESFVFTSIQVNVNYATRPHVDRNNLGRSQIIGLGEYTGGELWLHDDEGSVEETMEEDITQEPLYKKGTLWRGTNVDIREKWFEFNGNRLHCTRGYEGSRFSLVYYTCDRYACAAQPVRSKLHTMGFDFSWGSEALKLLLAEKKRERAAINKFFSDKARLGKRFGLWLQDGDQVAWQQENKKQEGCKAHERYNKYRKARTIGEARKLGCQTIDLQYDFNWGYLQVTGLDPNPPSWDIDVLDSSFPAPPVPAAAASSRRPVAVPKRSKDQPGVRLRSAELAEWRTGFEVDPDIVEKLFVKCPTLRQRQEQEGEEKDSRTGPTSKVPLRILRSLLHWALTGRFRLKRSDLEEAADILTSWGAFSSAEVLIGEMMNASTMNDGKDSGEEGEEGEEEEHNEEGHEGDEGEGGKEETEEPKEAQGSASKDVAGKCEEVCSAETT